MNQALVRTHTSLVQRGIGVVGPNAVLQLIETLHASEHGEDIHAVFNRAGLVHYLAHPPLAMVSEEHALRLFKAVGRELSEERAREVLDDAGRRTAQYVMANRIPGSVRSLLRVMPSFLATPLLCRAIKHHAWTFAGSGSCETSGIRRVKLDIKNNPLAIPDCPWHSAVILTMFRSLADRSMQLQHSYCCARGDAFCRFELSPGS